jgi:hypothetical protein
MCACQLQCIHPAAAIRQQQGIPEPCSQQVVLKASPTWPCGVVMAGLHLAGWCLSGYTALLPEFLRGGTGLLDSALVTCSFPKKQGI